MQALASYSIFILTRKLAIRYTLVIMHTYDELLDLTINSDKLIFTVNTDNPKFTVLTKLSDTKFAFCECARTSYILLLPLILAKGTYVVYFSIRCAKLC